MAEEQIDSGQSKPKRILLVDDDREIVESMRIALEACGYQILIARDGLPETEEKESMSAQPQREPSTELPGLSRPAGRTVLARQPGQPAPGGPQTRSARGCSPRLTRFAPIQS